MDASDEGKFFIIREHTGGIEIFSELACSPRVDGSFISSLSLGRAKSINV